MATLNRQIPRPRLIHSLFLSAAIFFTVHPQARAQVSFPETVPVTVVPIADINKLKSVAANAQQDAAKAHEEAAQAHEAAQAAYMANSAVRGMVEQKEVLALQERRRANANRALLRKESHKVQELQNTIGTLQGTLDQTNTDLTKAKSDRDQANNLLSAKSQQLTSTTQQLTAANTALATEKAGHDQDMTLAIGGAGLLALITAVGGFLLGRRRRVEPIRDRAFDGAEADTFSMSNSLDPFPSRLNLTAQEDSGLKRFLTDAIRKYTTATQDENVAAYKIVDRQSNKTAFTVTPGKLQAHDDEHNNDAIALAVAMFGNNLVVANATPEYEAELIETAKKMLDAGKLLDASGVAVSKLMIKIGDKPAVTLDRDIRPARAPRGEAVSFSAAHLTPSAAH